MPNVAARAIKVIEDPNASSRSLTEILSADAALASRVLKIANSAMFARQREIATLNQAITVVGFKTLKGIIIGATLKQMKSSFGELQKLVWENSMSTATCAINIAARLKKRYADEIFLLGLLHSLGQVVLLTDTKTPELYRQTLDLIKTNNYDWASAELKVFGFSHPLIGALVAKKWNFSGDTCQIILHCKDPISQVDLANELETKTAIVQLADLITHACKIGSPEGYPLNQDRIHELIGILSIPGATIEKTYDELITETKESFQNDRNNFD